MPASGLIPLFFTRFPKEIFNRQTIPVEFQNPLPDFGGIYFKAGVLRKLRKRRNQFRNGKLVHRKAAGAKLERTDSIRPVELIERFRKNQLRQTVHSRGVGRPGSSVMNRRHKMREKEIIRHVPGDIEIRREFHPFLYKTVRHDKSLAGFPNSLEQRLLCLFGIRDLHAAESDIDRRFPARRNSMRRSGSGVGSGSCRLPV